ncbi:hypothetical protein RJ527_18400 [Thalassospiraceae bacterium LMO-SO8]|nr:hypothetical protein [Alphaproteobacteria bacterium LMO-S08]WND75978.1 hypothetical protein RJ527_18400 [Thalassospiraceae bacterium LMO-SO8]
MKEPQPKSPRAVHVVETVKHLRKDCEEACLVQGLLLSMDRKIDDIGFEHQPLGVRRSILTIQKSLLSTIVLFLCRAYDHWDGKKSTQDRKCLQAVFSILENDKAVFDELIRDEKEHDLFRLATKKWDSLEKHFSTQMIFKALDHHFKKISSEEFHNYKKLLNIKRVLKGPRNEVLAHNLGRRSPEPSLADVRSLLSHTLQIIEPLSELFGGISVPLTTVNDVCLKQAGEFWAEWMPNK